MTNMSISHIYQPGEQVCCLASEFIHVPEDYTGVLLNKKTYDALSGQILIIERCIKHKQLQVLYFENPDVPQLYDFEVMPYIQQIIND